MLPRLFNCIEATRQTTKFYKPMHLAEQRRETERERKREMEKEQPKLKECREKKTITRLIYFHLREEREKEIEKERERESESSLLLTTELQSRAKRNTIKRGAREGGGEWQMGSRTA